MAADAEKMGAVFMDAPVSGGKFNILFIRFIIFTCVFQTYYS